jgi:hypothetical protein
MSTSDWLLAISLGVSAVVALIIAQRRNIEGLVGKRLDDLQEGITTLTEKSDDHSHRITRVETILEVNGCMDGPNCDRRKAS